MAIMLGYRVAGFPGALAATLGAVLPSFLLILAIAALFHSLGPSAVVDRAFAGVRAAVCALILHSTIAMGRRILKGRFETALACAAFVALFAFGVNAIWVILAGLAAGLLLKR